MKIATMVRGYLPAPRPATMVYSPLDIAVAISEGLGKRGHSITYFGPNGTHIPHVTTETNNLRALAHDQKELRELVESTDLFLHAVTSEWDHYLSRDMFERARNGEFDLLHFHHIEAALPYVKLYPDVPVVYTMHDPMDALHRELTEMYLTPNQFFVSISNNQRLPAPDLPYVATVYNGINSELFTFSDEPRDDYLLLVGRIIPEKGIKEAIQAAEMTDSRLLIIGPIFSEHQDYFDQCIKPHLNERILYLGFVEQTHIARYIQKARAFLMPIQWEEPFGLTMCEAMSCGTPVIAMNRGSVPEIVVNKKTGYIVNSVSEMVEAIKKVSSIDPAACRAHVEKNFTLDKMVSGYEAAFEKVLKTFKKQNIADKKAKKSVDQGKSPS